MFLTGHQLPVGVSGAVSRVCGLQFLLCREGLGSPAALTAAVPHVASRGRPSPPHGSVQVQASLARSFSGPPGMVPSGWHPQEGLDPLVPITVPLTTTLRPSLGCPTEGGGWRTSLPSHPHSWKDPSPVRPSACWVQFQAASQVTCQLPAPALPPALAGSMPSPPTGPRGW